MFGSLNCKTWSTISTTCILLHTVRICRVMFKAAVEIIKPPGKEVVANCMVLGFIVSKSVMSCSPRQTPLMSVKLYRKHWLSTQLTEIHISVVSIFPYHHICCKSSVSLPTKHSQFIIEPGLAVIENRHTVSYTHSHRI